MKKLLTIILLCFTFNSFSQTIDTVCAGKTGVVYSVTVTSGSSYSWSIDNNGTISSGQGSNEVTVNWTNNTGLDTIRVVETNKDGCSGKPSKLPVRRIPLPSALTIKRK